jgi:hypothetical protein
MDIRRWSHSAVTFGRHLILFGGFGNDSGRQEEAKPDGRLDSVVIADVLEEGEDADAVNAHAAPAASAADGVPVVRPGRTRGWRVMETFGERPGPREHHTAHLINVPDIDAHLAAAAAARASTAAGAASTRSPSSSLVFPPTLCMLVLGGRTNPAAPQSGVYLLHLASATWLRVPTVGVRNLMTAVLLRARAREAWLTCRSCMFHAAGSCAMASHERVGW